jgi:hypothetical protein
MNIITLIEKPNITICFVRKVSHLYFRYKVSARSVCLHSVWSYRSIYTSFVLILSNNVYEEIIIKEMLVNEFNKSVFTINCIILDMFAPFIIYKCWIKSSGNTAVT